MICHRTANYKLQMEITQKIHIQELWFLLSVCHLLVLHICTKFYEDILNSFKLQSGQDWVKKLLLKKFKGM